MTANCPCCGGKWDIEDQHYVINLRCGDELDIECGYCKKVIPFIIERKYLESMHDTQIQSLVNEIEQLEKSK